MTNASNESTQRRALAAAHRLVARRGWDDLVFTLLSARVPGEPEHLVVTPFPSMCSEVTASNLVKVDLAGKAVDGGRIDDGDLAAHTWKGRHHQVLGLPRDARRKKRKHQVVPTAPRHQTVRRG